MSLLVEMLSLLYGYLFYFVLKIIFFERVYYFIKICVLFSFLISPYKWTPSWVALYSKKKKKLSRVAFFKNKIVLYVTMGVFDLLKYKRLNSIKKFVAVAIVVTLWRPRAIRPYARWHQEPRLLHGAAPFCCVVKVLLMHLGF